MPGDNPRLLEALPKKDHFHCPLNVLVFSSETLLFQLLHCGLKVPSNAK